MPVLSLGVSELAVLLLVLSAWMAVGFMLLSLWAFLASSACGHRAPGVVRLAALGPSLAFRLFVSSAAVVGLLGPRRGRRCLEGETGGGLVSWGRCLWVPAILGRLVSGCVMLVLRALSVGSRVWQSLAVRVIAGGRAGHAGGLVAGVALGQGLAVLLGLRHVLWRGVHRQCWLRCWRVSGRSGIRLPLSVAFCLGARCSCAAFCCVSRCHSASRKVMLVLRSVSSLLHSRPRDPAAACCLVGSLRH